MILLLLSCGSCFHAKAPEAGPPVEASVKAEKPVVLDRFRLGINEAVGIPRALMERLGAAEQQQQLVRRAQEASSLGATLVRGHTGNYPFVSWSSLKEDPSRLQDMDAWVTAIQAAGLEPIAMVSPWPANQTGNYTSNYLPDDLNAYKTYVQQMVERYDGDGTDDMPGLRAPVRYWEVDNEPDLKNSVLPREATRSYDPATFCTPADYAAVLIASSSAIKAAFPDAKVLNGGPFRPSSPETITYMTALLAIPGVQAAFDVLSLHSYSDDPTGARLADGLRALRALSANKPLWITEVSSPSDPSPESREKQAKTLLNDLVQAATGGASAFLWHSLADPPGGRNQGYSLEQLSPDRSYQRKPAGEMYTALAHLAQTHDLNGLQEEKPGQYRLTDGSLLLTEGEYTAGSTGIRLPSGDPIAAGSPVTAPAWLSKM